MGDSVTGCCCSTPPTLVSLSSVISSRSEMVLGGTASHGPPGPDSGGPGTVTVTASPGLGGPMGPALSDRDALKNAARDIGTVIAGVGPNLARSRWPRPRAGWRPAA